MYVNFFIELDALHIEFLKIETGTNINESLRYLKPPIFFLYLNQFKQQVSNWKTNLCYKAIERIMETEELCKINSRISKILCWRTLRNIASLKYKQSPSS